MKHAHRLRTTRAAQAAVVAAIFGAGCQLVSGLDGLHHGTTGAGGASSASSSTGPSATTGGAGGSPSSSTTTSATVTSSGSGCTGSACDGGDGGPCDGGPCAPPVLLVPGPATRIPNSLASDGTYVYWSTPSVHDAVDAGGLDGAIYRKKIDDPVGPGTLVVGGIDPVQIVAGATFVAWIDKRAMGTGIYTVASDGDAGEVQLYPDKLPTALVERAGTLYWSVSANPSRISIGPAATSGPLTGTVYPGQGLSLMRFAVDDTSLYLSDASFIYKFGAMGMVDAGAAPLYGLGVEGVVWLLADATPGANIYWTTNGPGTVNVGSKSGGPAYFTHATTPTSNTIDHPLADGSNVYWFESEDVECATVQLVRMPAAGGEATPIATLPGGCVFAAQDAKNILWIHTFDGAIYRWVK